MDFNQVPGVEAWAIGNEGGFLAAPVNLTADNRNRLLMALAERADLIVDFTNVPVGNYILRNVGPDEARSVAVSPGAPTSRPTSTRPIRKPPDRCSNFRVVPAVAPDLSTPPRFLQLAGSQAAATRVPTIEKAGIGFGADGNRGRRPRSRHSSAPSSQVFPNLQWLWMDLVTENPGVGDTEVREIYNTTADARSDARPRTWPSRSSGRQGRLLGGAEGEEVVQPIQLDGDPTQPRPWETGVKDTVVALPGQVTRIRAHFETPGQYVWHCHIVEHEDNEMMRPYRIGPEQPGQPE